jgi:beta-phosphoglucomutase family hydrolase
MIDGAIFDMDGVLLDNASYHIRAWQQLGSELGENLSDAEIRKVFGQRNREMLGALMGRTFSEDELMRLTGHKEEIYRGIIAPHLAPTAGLPEFLKELKKGAVKTAVATSGPRDNVRFVLERLALEPYFDAVITGVDVTNSKPAPDIFLLAARRIGLAAPRCVVFEDSVAGIEASHRAGCPCVALSTTHPFEELSRTTACRVVRDFTELRVSDLSQFP